MIDVSNLQLIILIVTSSLVSTGPSLRMPIASEKYVELFCNLPLEALLASLSLNLLLIVLCAAYGFLTRKLPENFNESWYIFVSVSTTTFLWMVFLPTYFSTFRAYHQAALLAFCLIMNASVTHLCLYIPKLYALYFVDKSKLHLDNSTVQTVSSRIVPVLPTLEEVQPIRR